MKLTDRESDAIKSLTHGESKYEFSKFLGAIATYASNLNEALIYGKKNSDMSLETRQGMTLAVVEIIKAIESASQVVIEKPEDTDNGPA